MIPDLPIVVLAAGASTRMRGRDKLMEEVDGRPLIARQAGVARSVTAGPVIVALPPRPHPRYDALAGLDVTPLPVPGAAEGLGASLRTAIVALPEGTPAAMLVLADLPDLTADDLRAVAQAARAHPDKLVWRGATEGGQPGHPIVVSAPLFPRLAHLSGESGGRDVLAAVGNRTLLVPLPGEHALADLDTPEDWAAWRRARGETG